ncbi:MAG: hypothetical protein H6701_03600 [Myxococcales bacterium]|nr:hypothetical protein [Myxococcales bacterium]
MTPRPLALLLALTLPGCHEDATHADLAPGGAEPPRCDELRQLEPCPFDGLVARQYLSPEPGPRGETLDSVWTWGDPNPIVGWYLAVELCAYRPGQPTTLTDARRALIWHPDGSFERLDNHTNQNPPYYARTRCRPDSSTAVERETLVDGNYRIEYWPPRP